MEKFMFLFRGSDVYLPGRAPEALQILKEKLFDWVGELSKNGLHITSVPLQAGGRQVGGPEKSVHDGPFGKTREVIGGCTVVQANNMDEAVEIAKSCPILESNATIEIRPVQ
jgi:hypothetical protein